MNIYAFSEQDITKVRVDSVNVWISQNSIAVLRNNKNQIVVANKWPMQIWVKNDE